MVRPPDPRRFLERKLPSLWAVVQPVLGAAAVALVLDLLLAPPDNAVEAFATMVAYPLGVGFAMLVGVWLGARAWPKRGGKLARTLLRRLATRKKRPVLFLTNRPDFEPTIPRRILEVVGFAAGVSILVPAVLQVLDAPPGLVRVLGSIITLLALWGSFVLVPYWALGRLGIRQVDPVRWLVEPVSLQYADKLRLSNGALLLISAGAAVNLAYRAGASGDEALLQGVSTVASLVAGILVIAAAGVAYFARAEKQLVRELEEEALRLGVRDGRGMSDGEFLPRVP